MSDVAVELTFGAELNCQHGRSSSDPLYDLDPEIEITLRRLRKARNIVVSNNSNSISSFDNSSLVTNTSDSIEHSSTNNFAELDQMENNDRTLKDLATPDVARSAHALEGIPCGLFQNEIVGDTRRLHQDDGVPILPGWSSKRLAGDMKRMFLEKLFPAFRTVTIRKEICGIRQHSRETLHEYCERFNKLCATCPHHQIREQLLIQYFYEGLTMMDCSMIDAASGGALMDKMLATTRHLISNMASNTQKFGIRGASQPRMLTELTSLVRQLAVGQHQPSIAARVCGICTSVQHPTDMCPTLQEIKLDHLESVGAIGGYQCGKQLYQIWKATISARTESRAICSSTIWIHPECTARTNRLSKTDPTILSTTVPTIATIKNASSRKFTISRGPDEAISN
ncbi:hypothetical protein CR513_21454, partial [Mucuna pruriens]